jgi:hypothetical protein
LAGEHVERAIVRLAELMEQDKRPETARKAAVCLLEFAAGEDGSDVIDATTRVIVVSGDAAVAASAALRERRATTSERGG